MNIEATKGRIITKMVVLIEMNDKTYQLNASDELSEIALRVLAKDGLELVETEFRIE